MSVASLLRERRRSRSGSAPLRLIAHLRSSLLTKVVAALVVALVVSALVTGVVEARLTRAALARRTQTLAGVNSHLAILSRLIAEREDLLINSLDNLGQTVTSARLLDPTRQADLVAELGRVSRNLGIDVMIILDRVGNPIPGTRIGPELERTPLLEAIEASDPARSSRLLTSTNGGVFQAVLIRMEPAAQPTFLLGGFDFTDPAAYELRSVLGPADDVLLVAHGRVSGNTLRQVPRTPPGASRAGRLPGTPAAVKLAGEDRVVAYAPIASPVGGRAEGAVGVVLPDPVPSLDRSLGPTRFAASVLLALVAVVLGWLLFRALTRPLVRLAGTARQIAEGDLDASFGVYREDEIGILASSLESMTVELRAREIELRESSKRIAAAQDEERRRLARDLHDGIQQQLVTMAVKLKRTSSRPPEDARELLSDLASEAEEAVFALQEVSRGIYPSVLADQGLPAALRTQSSRMPLDIKVELDETAASRRYSREVESALYFVALEAMTNAQKHAGGAHITVRLSLDRDTSELAVEVADDGPGFVRPGVAKGAGLQNMADRMLAVGGRLEVEPRPEGGTVVRATVPVEPAGHGPSGGA
jgi:signal transduction histidine kinase